MSARRARALPWACAVLALTSLHHAYGAIHYATPWRDHVVLLSAVTLAVLLLAYRLGRARPGTRAGRVATGVFLGVSWIVPVLLIGAFEGLYNHVAKGALYLAGLSDGWMARLFPPPMYEMPDDVFFEVTGVLSVAPAALAAFYLADLGPGAGHRRTA